MNDLNVVSWIGCGNVGKTIARAFRECGYKIGTVTCRSKKSATEAVRIIGSGTPGSDPVEAIDSGLIHFIAVNDDALPAIVKQLEAKGPESLSGHFIFHTSGSISSTVLDPLRTKGAETGSIHPLQVFADPVKALESLPGTYFAIEGTDKAMALAVQLVDKLQGKLLLIPTNRKVLYHVAGVFAANYLTVLVDHALQIMEELGETREDSYQAFLPLMVGALQNIEEFGTSQALTGPISRGDEATISNHLQAMDQLPSEFADAYKLLGLGAVDLAVRGGKIDKEKASVLRKLLM